MEMRVKLLILLAFIVFLPFPPTVVALALSDVELESNLNQRLSARISLLEVTAAEMDDLNIRVSEITDTVAGGRRKILSHEVVVEGLKYYLRISTRDVVREPILSFVVELNWSTGHIIRNYALIIDPQ
jgi:pilus assembly protein FimV